jgi:hypothetical protein
LIWSAIPQKNPSNRYYHGRRPPEHDLRVVKQALEASAGVLSPMASPRQCGKIVMTIIVTGDGHHYHKSSAGSSASGATFLFNNWKI